MTAKLKNFQMPKEVVLEESTATDTYSKFKIEPLERGLGTTLGNALRRALLSSIPGAAITSVRIDGALHEFSTIPGVYEDVVEIVLNLKKVRLRMHEDGPRSVYLEISKKGDYTAADLVCDPTVEIVNPGQHLLKLNDNSELKIEMEVDTGRGYVSSEQNKKPDQPIGTIPLDATFSPVSRVNFSVENTRVGQRTDYDRLLLEIWTDGTMTPEETLAFAAKLLKDHLMVFICKEEEIEIPEEEVVDEETIRIRNLLKMRVDELELSVRSSNCLQAANIQIIDDLVQKSEAEMLKYRNFGKKSLNELNAVLSEMGLHFGMDISRYREPSAKE